MFLLQGEVNMRKFKTGYVICQVISETKKVVGAYGYMESGDTTYKLSPLKSEGWSKDNWFDTEEEAMEYLNTTEDFPDLLNDWNYPEFTILKITKVV